MVLGALSIFLAYSFVGIWLIRNKIVLNTWRISGDQGVILFGYHYEPLMRSLGLKQENENILCVGQGLFSVECNKIQGKLAIQEILKYKAEYLKFRLVYAPLFFLSSGYDNIYSRLTGAVGFDKYFRGDLVSSFTKGDINGALKMMFRAPKITALLIGFSFWFLITALAIIGFWRLFKISKDADLFVIIFIGVLIIYFDLITTPLITARYRLPINPFIFIFAVSGLLYLKQLIKKNV